MNPFLKTLGRTISKELDADRYYLDVYETNTIMETFAMNLPFV